MSRIEKKQYVVSFGIKRVFWETNGFNSARDKPLNFWTTRQTSVKPSGSCRTMTFKYINFEGSTALWLSAKFYQTLRPNVFDGLREISRISVRPCRHKSFERITFCRWTRLRLTAESTVAWLPRVALKDVIFSSCGGRTNQARDLQCLSESLTPFLRWQAKVPAFKCSTVKFQNDLCPASFRSSRVSPALIDSSAYSANTS